MARRINAPGIEVNEIDRSNYEQTVDNSTVGTATLVFGFSDKGDDYTVRWINTMNTFTRTYGVPQTDAERYFYNSVYDILNGGGVCYTAKLPYFNYSLDNFTYTSYSIDDCATVLSNPVDIVDEMKKDEQGNEFTFRQLLFYPQSIPSISSLVLSSQDDFQMVQMQELRDFVQKMSNFGVRSQNVLDNVILSGNVERRTATTVLEGILDGSSEWLQSEMEFQGIQVSSEALNMQRCMKDAFGDTASMHDVIDMYSKGAYLHKFRDMYERMVEKYGDGIRFDGDTEKLNYKYTDLRVVDNSVTSYASINPDVSGTNEIMSFDNYDKFLIKQLRVPLNKIYIVDKTRGKYEKDSFGNEILGIVPVIVTPANALFYQNVIEQSDSILSDYNVVRNVRNSYRYHGDQVFDETVQPFDQSNTTVQSVKGGDTRQFVGMVDYLGQETFNDGTRVGIHDFTTSQVAAERFPTMKFINDRLDRKYLKQIGIVVFKAYMDEANENKVAFFPVESFVGSLDRTARDEQTGQVIFIDDVVNSNSDYINVFSNADIRENDKDPLGLKNASTYALNNQTACSMGFYNRDTIKLIHVQKSIYQPLLKIFERNEDRNTLDVDIMIDGGVSNIAQFIASTQLYVRDEYTGEETSIYVKDEFQRCGTFDFNNESAHLFKLDSRNQCNVWRKVIERFDDFAKNVRKDLIFIADGPRPLCLEGNDPVVRRTRPENTIKKSILPKMKIISGIFNSSYSAGYLNWFYSMDMSTGSYMWLPPSIKALGVYLYTDNNGSYWDAPAGLNRGRISRTRNVAFNPTNEEAGQIYINSWNYAVSYPLDGIILEGQKTFQVDKTALDRVNVRRLMLGMEKVIRNMCKYFNYEGNTEFQRTRIKDLIDRYLEQVRANDGISQYITVCDERNNTEQTIENNELHITIAVRPIKTIEFIVLNFIATNQSTDVEEVIDSELGA